MAQWLQWSIVVPSRTNRLFFPSLFLTDGHHITGPAGFSILRASIMFGIRQFHARTPISNRRLGIKSVSHFRLWNNTARTMPFVTTLLRRGYLSSPSSASPLTPEPELLPPDVPIDEERVPGYKLEAYYPANPGDVLGGRFELKAKLGWGSTSTVWLAQNIRRYTNSLRLF